MDHLHDLFWVSLIELLPSLEELDDSVSLIVVSCKEGVHVFERSLLNELLEWLERENQVADASLRLIKQLGWLNRCLFVASTSSYTWHCLLVNHVVIAHQDLSLLSELVSQEDSSLVLLLILVLEDQVEARDLLFNLTIVAPTDLIQILSRNVTVNKAFT